MGRVSQPKQDKTKRSTANTLEQDKSDKHKMGMSDLHPTLNVNSVKLIAATCPCRNNGGAGRRPPR